VIDFQVELDRPRTEVCAIRNNFAVVALVSGRPGKGKGRGDAAGAAAVKNQANFGLL
jgi:hypothetical protein